MNVYYEIEDMKTGDIGVVGFESTDSAHDILIKKGFDCLSKFELYAGFSNKTGNEISVMPFTPIHPDRIIKVNGKSEIPKKSN